MGKLANERHETFCQEYLIDLNATQAYIRAGYKPKNAGNCASVLLDNPKIRARIDELMARRSMRTGVTQDQVIRELARIAFLDPAKLANMDDASLNLDAGADDRAAIAAVKVKSGVDFTEREIKFADKIKALELLGKHMGMFTENINLNVEMPQIVDDINADANADKP